MLKTRTLGKTGFDLTEIGFGAWAIGGRRYGPVAQSDGIDAIHAYIKGGGNFIDTARSYGSEPLLGQYFAQHGGRENIFIATKAPSVEPDDIRSDLETSLRELQTDYIDLYYLHRPPENPDHMNRLLDLYDQLKVEGKIRATGASIKGPTVTQNTTDLCQQYIQSGRVDALQVIYSIYRQKTAEIFQESHNNGVGIVARTVLESGFLTGKYKPGQTFSGDDHRKRWGTQRLESILQQTQDLQSIVKPPYTTLSQIAIRFALQCPEVTTLILGARNASQIEQNFSAEDLPPLDTDLYQSLIEQYTDKTETFNPGN